MSLNYRHCLPLLLLGSLAGIAPGAAPTVSLAPAPNSPLPINAYALAIADVNADHHQDLIVTAEHLQIFLGDGSGRFRPTPDFDLDLKGHATELAIGDVNPDGNLDVITADHQVYSVSVSMGDGKGKFAPAPGSPFWPKRG